MRLRIQTKAPLPELKVWFSPHPHNLPTTVSELKHAICRQVPALRTISENGLLLLLDDFEVLDDNPLDVVRDGDLIHVKLLPGLPEFPITLSRTRKRKRASSIPEQSFRPPIMASSLKRKKEFIVKPFLESDSSDSDETNSSLSSSSSSSSSTSISSSSTTSSSSSSGPPSLQPSKATKVKSMRPLDPSYVPPGHGKPQTHSRNLRRRLKKKHDKGLLPTDPAPAPPKNSSAPNIVPLGSRTSNATDVNASSRAGEGEGAPRTQMAVDEEIGTSQVEPRGITTMNQDGGNIMMSTLRNKNKRKSFKQSMAAPLPPKIVFDEERIASGSGASTTHEVVQALMKELPGVEVVVAARPKLLPPSEKQERGELPPRMFVTSVDVEAGLQNNSQHKKKKKQKQKEPFEEDWESYGYQDTMEVVEEDVQLDYADDVIGSTGGINWDVAEKGWDQFVEVTDIGQLTVGTLVGWKGLALNPLTFSPEVLLSVATIVHLPNSSGNRQLVIKPLLRPGGSNPSLSYRLIVPAEDEEETEEEEHTWEEVLSSHWKIIVIP